MFIMFESSLQFHDCNSSGIKVGSLQTQVYLLAHQQWDFRYNMSHLWMSGFILLQEIYMLKFGNDRFGQTTYQVDTSCAHVLC